MSGASICAAAAAFMATIVTWMFLLNDPSSLWRLGAQESSAADGRLSRNYLDASRTGYHFQPEKNWMNDPNGPMFYKGYYHFFYQYNPNRTYWGSGLAWGHAVSTDLIHWRHLDLAMLPDQWYDIEGVWSGSATILRNGTPAIIYTGVRSTFLPDDAVQSQNLAMPVDPSDALLRKWKKADTNPVLTNPNSVKAQDLRDPTTAWLEKDGQWRMVVGGKKDISDGSTNGIALLFKSEDFIHWDVESTLYEVKGSVLWECVDFYPVTVERDRDAGDQKDPVLLRDNYENASTYVLKASLFRSDRDHYELGSYSTETHTFAAHDADRDVGLEQSLLYDYGKFYASKTFYDSRTGRRILFAWVNESDSVQDQQLKGWASLQVIPRTVWLDGKTFKNVLQWPIEEVESLREAKVSHHNILLPSSAVLKVEEIDGPQLDVVVEFEMPDLSSTKDEATLQTAEFDCSRGSAHRGLFGPFGILVHANEEFTEQTAIFFYVSPSKDGSQWTTKVCSDQSRSTLAPDIDKTNYGGVVTVLPTENVLALRVLVDHSIVETFAQGGRVAITARVYPTVSIGDKAHLFLFNNGTTPIRVTKLDAYQMATVHMTNF